MLKLFVIAALFGFAAAKFAWPVPSYYVIEKQLRKAKGGEIRWDRTNRLTDLSGTLTLCERLKTTGTGAWGTANVKKARADAEPIWKQWGIDPSFYPPAEKYAIHYLPILNPTAADAKSVESDISAKITTYTGWNADLEKATRFGCSVEPMCPTATTGLTKPASIIVCVFNVITPDPSMRGFNQTWGSHSHDMYTSAAKYIMDDAAFPEYIYVEDELHLQGRFPAKAICDDYVYNPKKFEVDVKKAIEDLATGNIETGFGKSMTPDKMMGWYLGFNEDSTATITNIYAMKDRRVPTPVVNLIDTMFRVDAAKPNTWNKNTITMSTRQHYSHGACNIVVCPEREVPKPGPVGGKSTKVSTFYSVVCAVFKSAEEDDVTKS